MNASHAAAVSGFLNLWTLCDVIPPFPMILQLPLNILAFLVKNTEILYIL